MRKYNVEFKESVLSQMEAPDHPPLRELAQKNNMSYSTLVDWRRELKASAKIASGDNEVTRNWSSRDKFLIVIETAAMNEEERNAYCRSKGIYPEQLELWKEACVAANGDQVALARTLRGELREEREKSRLLERDLKRKERALAETAALLVLRKKADAIWGEGEEE